MARDPSFVENCCPLSSGVLISEELISTLQQDGGALIYDSHSYLQFNFKSQYLFEVFALVVAELTPTHFFNTAVLLFLEKRGGVNEKLRVYVTCQVTADKIEGVKELMRL